MTRNDNIFYRLTRKNENTATELLCNLFRSKYIRNICLKYFNIPEEVIEEIKLENITTQKYFPDAGIPDIVIENVNCFYIIENKIRTGTLLQESQKTFYIDSVNKYTKIKRNIGFIFIVPENYSHIDELQKLVEQHNGLVKLILWEDFLKYLLDLEIQKESPIIKESLDYLIKIITGKTSLYDEGINLTPYEVAMLYNPKDVLESLKLCDKVFSLVKGIQNDLITIKECILTPSDEYKCVDTVDIIGKFFAYNAKPCIFIGLSLNLINYNVPDIRDINKKPDDYIFSIAFEKKYLKKELIIQDGYNDYFDDDDWLYFPLNKKYFLENDNIELLKDQVIDIIRNVFMKNVLNN
ncbi:MAG: PD-(D/E)XK nuclease family protein [Treponema sp.]|nr:PD-(D/E)XK nuclease family protein [Treponema sp.]